MGLKIKTKECIHKVYTMKNIGYKYIKIQFCNWNGLLINTIINILYLLAFPYFLFNKLIQVTTTTKEYSNNGTYININSKWILDLKLYNDKILKEMNNCIKSNRKKMIKSGLKTLYPFFNLTDNGIFKYSKISSQISGSCIMSENKDNGVVNNNGLILWGSSNLRIISSAFYTKLLDGNSPLIYFLFGYITAKNFIK